MSKARERIAVIGGGVAGITACHILQRANDVTLFEKNNYVGGHTSTVVLDSGPDEGLAVDTGFIVCNDKTYPNFHELLRQLNVKVRWSDMSFSYYCKSSGFYYAGTDLFGMFAQRRNLLSPRMWRMLTEIAKFSRRALLDLNEGRLEGATLGDYLKDNEFSSTLIDDYIYPMGSAIWSAPRDQLGLFPAEAFVAFFRNHGLLSIKDRPRWQTVVGGSHSYVKSFLSTWEGDIFTEVKVSSIRRTNDGVLLYFKDGSVRDFDKVVIATHADQALKLLDDPSAKEKKLLGAWSYENNHTVLHTDESVLPPVERAWASWNYVREKGAVDSEPASVSYYMNKLQGFKTERKYSVTLNRKLPFKDSSIIREFNYSHPQYTLKSLATQKEFPSIQGEQNTYYCGSYHGHGFHEDAVSSAIKVAECFGMSLEDSPQLSKRAAIATAAGVA